MGACAEWEGLIAGAIYGGLEAPERSRLDRHLAECEGCRSEHDELARTAKLAEPGKVELSEAERGRFLEGVASRIDALPKVRGRTRRRVLVVRRSWTGAFALAAVALLAVLSVLLVSRWNRPEPLPEVAVESPAPPVLPPVVLPADVTPTAPPVAPPAPPPPPPAPAPEPPKPPVPEKPPAPPAPPEKPAPPPPAPRPTVAVMAHVERVQGDVAVITEEGRVPAKAGLGLVPGQEIRTSGRSAFAAVKVTDGTRLELSADGALRLLSDWKAGSASRSFRVEQGVLSAQVARQPAGQPMSFVTPHGEAKVLGTQLVLNVGTEVTRLEVREGRVRLTRAEDGASVEVTRDHYAMVLKGAALAAKPARASAGLQALYLFDEGRGATVRDVSGSGAPIDLRIVYGRSSTWSPAGLAVQGNPKIESDGPPARLIEACRKSNELTIEAWVKPARAAVPFDGAIVALSRDVDDRNFALVQGDRSGPDHFSATLRTSATDAQGGEHLNTARGSAETRLTHLVFTRAAAGQEKLYVNGVERVSRSREGTFGNWNETFRLILGNEATDERPWAGEYRLVAVYSRALAPAEVVRNYRTGSEP